MNFCWGSTGKVKRWKLTVEFSEIRNKQLCCFIFLWKYNHEIRNYYKLMNFCWGSTGKVKRWKLTVEFSEIRNKQLCCFATLISLSSNLLWGKFCWGKVLYLLCTYSCCCWWRVVAVSGSVVGVVASVVGWVWQSWSSERVDCQWRSPSLCSWGTSRWKDSSSCPPPWAPSWPSRYPYPAVLHPPGPHPHRRCHPRWSWSGHLGWGGRRQGRLGRPGYRQPRSSPPRYRCEENSCSRP